MLIRWNGANALATQLTDARARDHAAPYAIHYCVCRYTRNNELWTEAISEPTNFSHQPNGA